MEVPGTITRHRYITDTCRTHKGDDVALAEALADAEDAAKHALRGWNVGRGARIHIVVTVERPQTTETGEQER